MRRVGITAVAAGLALVMGACTGHSDQDNGIASAQSASATQPSSASADGVNDGVKEAQCLRDQGIPAGDPATAEGKPVIPETVSREQLDAAHEHCPQFAPDYGKAPPPMDPARVDLLRRFAQCMREQGVDWDDPDPNGRRREPEVLARASERGPGQDSAAAVEAAKVCDQKVPGTGVTFEGVGGPKGSDPTK